MPFQVRGGTKGGVIDFGAQLTAFADAIEASVDDIARQVALALYNGIKARTPVDTGFARAQWQILFEGDEVMVRPVGDHAAQDAATVAGFSVKVHGAIVIANGAAYIKRLEYEGHSNQAPEGMVRVTMAEVQARLDEIMKAALRERGIDGR